MFSETTRLNQAESLVQLELAETEYDMRNFYEQERFLRKLTKSQAYLEILVPHLNTSEQAISGSNKIKEEHETMKLQNEEVMLKNLYNLD